MRTTFIKTLEKVAARDDSIFLLTADLGFKLFDRFRDAYSERFINVGVAEANMIGIAAGLALSGKNVYCYSIAPFLTMRCLEQIRIDLCYQNLNVKLLGIGGGLVYGLEGTTHHAVEDLAIMRSLPNMTVVAPGDKREAEALANESVRYQGPIYIRLSKEGGIQVHKTTPGLKIGKGFIVKEGAGLTIITAGNLLFTSKSVSDILESKNVKTTLISMHTIKPLDIKLLERCLKTSKAIFTIEEHSIVGGLGSAVAEVLLELGYKGIFRRFGLPDRYGPYIGKTEYLRKKYRLTPKAIANSILRVLNYK